MKISTRGAYALEVAVDLAMHSGEESLESLKNIAVRRQLSEKYLEKIVKSLKKSGILISVRGAHGGYRLGRPAGELTVRDVLTAAEGALAPVECLTKESSCGTDCNICPTRGTWGMIWQEIIDVTGMVTILDIIQNIGK